MHNSHLNRPFQARLLQLTLLQHQLFSNLTPTNNSERSCPRSHENSQTSPHNLCPKITSLAKNPSTHLLQNSISYLQHSSNLSTLLHSPTSHHPTTRVYSLIIISFLVSPSSLFFFEVLQPLLCLRCTSSLERTPKRPPSVCTSSQPSS